MRIYEFAKKFEIPTKKVLEVLQKNGFSVTSHMSILDDGAVAFLEKTFGPQNEQAQKKASPQKDVAPDQKKQKKAEEPVAARKNSREKAVDVEVPQVEEKIKSITLQPTSVTDVAIKAGVSVNDLILTLLRWGILSAKNQILKEDVVARLARHYQLEIVQPVAQEEQVERVFDVSPEKLQERLPIVAVLGHVDHGKTTLLDFIRKTRVASREKGGITQHLGAYEAVTPRGNIVFLDTPGHEAFSKIRQRGIKVADIVILVVAADDGVMPQTLEALRQAKSMNVPIIVAINKVDKVEPQRLEVIKRQLAQHDLIVEDWGGDVICVPISAKFGQGVDHLLEMILLQAQMMELRADVSGMARGYILESSLEKGRGPVATLICQHGTIKIGDYIVTSSTSGKVNSIVDSHGKRLAKAGPAIPIQISGFDALPEVGDFFEVVLKSDVRKATTLSQEKKSAMSARLFTQGAINLVVKADNDSSKEALANAIDKLTKKATETGFNILHLGVGNINESDIEFAYNTGASIVGLHVKCETNATALAQQRNVSVRVYDIIYKLLEDLEKRIEQTKKVEMISTKVGEAIVIRVFEIKNIGVIAGAQVKDGRFVRDAKAVVYRRNAKIGEGKITSLQREKKAVKEVHAGFEFGLSIEKFIDWAIDDRIECYVEVPKK
jgi:translation initiation factor IF-2